jgi:signal transduction histidine kinase
MLFDRQGTFWIASFGDGLRRARNVATLGSGDIGQFSDAVDKYGRADGLTSDVVQCLFEDREGNIWAGTSAGLDCFSENKVTSITVREGLPFDQKLVLQATPDGSIWAGSTPRGVEEIKDGGKQFIDWHYGGVTVPGALVAVNGLYADPKGGLLAATRLGVLDFEPGHTNATLLPGGSYMKYTYAMARDSSGTLWVSGANGVNYLTNGRLARVSFNARLRGDYPYEAHADAAGRVWFGTVAGELISYQGSKEREYTVDDGLFPGPVRVIIGDAAGQTWVAGQGGISRFKDQRFQTLSRRNGLPFDDIFAVLEDDLGFFWLQGWSGLFRVSTNEFNHALASPDTQVTGDLFEISDGLREFGHGTALGDFKSSPAKAADGRLWFPAIPGIVVVDPRNLPRNPLPPPVHIKRVIFAGQTNQTFDHLEFPVGARSCEIDYTALSFVNPQKVRYKYRLSGVDEKWVDAGSRRQAFYSNLKPGTYQFQVLACNNDGVWNETGDTLGFSVTPTFYETVWFPILCVVAGGLALFGLYQLRQRQLRARQNLQAKLARAEQVASFAEVSASIAHEINQPLAAVVTNAKAGVRWLDHPVPNLEEARAAMQRIARDGDRTREVVARIRALFKKEQPLKTSVNLNEVIQEIVSLTGDLLNGTVLEMELATNLPGVSVDRVQIQQVVFNLVKNGVESMKTVAGRPHVLRIQSKLAGSNMVLVAVQDSGTGLPQEKMEQIFQTFYTTKSEGLGLGLSISRSIIESHGGRLSANANEAGPGATFEFTLPVEKAEAAT